MTYTPLHSKDLREELQYLLSFNWKKLPSRDYYRWEDKAKYVGAGPHLSSQERKDRIAQCRKEIAEAVD